VDLTKKFRIRNPCFQKQIISCSWPTKVKLSEDLDSQQCIHRKYRLKTFPPTEEIIIKLHSPFIVRVGLNLPINFVSFSAVHRNRDGKMK
jgi:hypothetical protein